MVEVTASDCGGLLEVVKLIRNVIDIDKIL